MWFYKLSWESQDPHFYYSYQVFYCFLESTDETGGVWHMTICKKLGKLDQGCAGSRGMSSGWWELAQHFEPSLLTLPSWRSPPFSSFSCGWLCITVSSQDRCGSWPSDSLPPATVFLRILFLHLLCWFLLLPFCLLKCFLLYRTKFKRPWSALALRKVI